MGRKITPEEEELVRKEINQMLKKGAIISRSKGAIIYCPQERWRQQASDQFKQTEQFYSLSLYWNGGFVSSKETTFAKR